MYYVENMFDPSPNPPLRLPKIVAFEVQIPAMIAKKVEEALRTKGQVETDEIKKIKKVSMNEYRFILISRLNINLSSQYCNCILKGIIKINENTVCV